MISSASNFSFLDRCDPRLYRLAAPLLDIVDLCDSKRIPLNQAERAAIPGDYPYYGANGQVGTVGKYLFEGPHILLAEDGGFFDQPGRGVAYAVDGQFWVNNHAHILAVRGEMPVGYLLRLLNALDWMKFVSGTTRLKLTQGGMSRIELPIPPLAEQNRIVAKLDTLTARLTRARAELDRVGAMAKAMRANILADCFATRDALLPLGKILTAIESGKNMRCEERPPVDGEKGVVKVSAVTWGRFNPAASKTLPFDYVPPEKARINEGDLLISRANTLELVGAPVIVEHQPNELYLSDKILRLVMPMENKDWVLWFLRSPLGREQIQSLATGNQMSMRNISQDALRRIMIPMPESEARMKRIHSLELAFARADRLEVEAARARALLDRLEAALLARAFRGELVPQDPADEPASVLLDRIRIERAAAPAAKRGRRVKEAA